jgi:uncharacterized membrane protein YhaH (DUF805 family)
MRVRHVPQGSAAGPLPGADCRNPGRPFSQQLNSTQNMNYYTDVLKKYTVFTGRARRKEYWMFVLFNFIIAIVLSVLSRALHFNIVLIYDLAVLLPSIAVGIRRMHDTNHSGWWLLLPIVNLIFAIMEGDKGENRFGPDPKAGSA